MSHMRMLSTVKVIIYSTWATLYNSNEPPFVASLCDTGAFCLPSQCLINLGAPRHVESLTRPDISYCPNSHKTCMRLLAKWLWYSNASPPWIRLMMNRVLSRRRFASVAPQYNRSVALCVNVWEILCANHGLTLMHVVCIFCVRCAYWVSSSVIGYLS